MSSTDRRSAIATAYLGSVRSVLLVDDQFPSYEHLATEDMRRAFKETDRAVKLWQGFRKLGWACDIVPQVEQLRDEYVRMRDLVVLDYELQENDGGVNARRFLRKLVDDARQHLVILYTNETIATAHRDIAISLAGNPRSEPLAPLDEDAGEEYREWKREHREILTKESILLYIARDERWHSRLLESVGKTDKGSNMQRVKEYLERMAQDFLREAEGSHRSNFQSLQYSDGQHTWVRCDNVFVVLVAKALEHGSSDFELVEHLKDRLLASLDEWAPSFLRIMLSFARGRLIEKGLVGDDRVLRDAVNEAAWLFYMSHCEDDAERRERIGMLYGRMLEDLLRDSIREIEQFSRTHPSNSQDAGDPIARLASARARAGVVARTPDFHILHKLNHFLAFEPTSPRYVQTGTVFANETLTEFGVCSTPDCDLVPRPRSGGEAKELFPFTRMIYRPIPLVTDKGKIEELLKKAEDSQALFLYLEDSAHKYIVLKLVEQAGVHPAARMLLLSAQGVIDTEGRFAGYKLRAGEGADEARPVAEEGKFRVIGQLRARYAMRILHEAGHYLSRMGVDFVDWPPRPRE